MEACIFDIKRFAIHDGPGIRVTVFFKGCPMSCQWCHNPEGIPSGIDIHSESIEFEGVQITRDVEVGRWINPEDLVSEIERDRVFIDESGGGVTFSGGEPLLQADTLIELLELCRKKGIHTAVDTSGHATAKIIHEVCSRSDLILFDLKSLNDMRHKELTGISNKSILRNLDIVLRSGTETIVRIPFIPGFNDQATDISDMLDFLRPYKQLMQVDILPYHAYANHKYKKFQTPFEFFPVPTNEQIRKSQKIIEDAGYKVTTGG
jgi:pyruvate formate lyase activating enzyme